MQSFSTFCRETKKLLASQKRDRLPVGPGRAGPCRAVPCRAESGTLIVYHIHSNETSFTSFSRNQANVEQTRNGDPKKIYKLFCYHFCCFSFVYRLRFTHTFLVNHLLYRGNHIKKNTHEYCIFG